jgi:histone-lysine N-methyltransferase SETD3
VLLQLPESLAVTSIDAEKHELVGPIAGSVSQLIGITLWLMAERAKGAGSAWVTLLQTLPDSTASPILWEDQVGGALWWWCSGGAGGKGRGMLKVDAC